MRTTITLDPDVVAQIRRVMAERGLSFKQAVNDAIRAGARAGERQERTYTIVRHMGRPRANLDKALQLAAELEDEELLRKQALAK